MKSHFRYNKRQRNGVFFLLLIIIALQFLFFYADFPSEEPIDFSQTELLDFQKEMDSLKAVKLENKKPKIYPFNPSFITDFKGYQLGMSLQEIDKLHAFREKGEYVNSAKQFQEVTKVSDSLLEAIRGYFKFPDWFLANKKSIKQLEKRVDIPLTKRDINAAKVSDLKVIRGVGDKLAARIINYRTKLQGFSYNDQLNEVWYLEKEVVEDILRYFEVKAFPEIQKININEATFKQVLSIVYIDYELTKKILNYRDEVAEIQSLEELKKIDGFPLDKFNRIALYLQAK